MAGSFPSLQTSRARMCDNKKKKKEPVCWGVGTAAVSIGCLQTVRHLSCVNVSISMQVIYLLAATIVGAPDFRLLSVLCAVLVVQIYRKLRAMGLSKPQATNWCQRELCHWLIIHAFTYQANSNQANYNIQIVRVVRRALIPLQCIHCRLADL